LNGSAFRVEKFPNSSYLRGSVFIDNPFVGAHYLAISVLNPVKLTEIEIRAVEAHGRLYVQI